MTYAREVTKLTIITLAYIDYFYVIRNGPHGVVDVSVDFEPMCPGFESRESDIYIYFFL